MRKLQILNATYNLLTTFRGLPWSSKLHWGYHWQTKLIREVINLVTCVFWKWILIWKLYNSHVLILMTSLFSCFTSSFSFISYMEVRIPAGVYTLPSTNHIRMVKNVRTNILSSNFMNFLHGVSLNFDNDIFWQNFLNQANEFDSNLEGLKCLRKTYCTNPMIGYLNINILRDEISSLREITQKVPKDILCIYEIKLGESCPNSQFKIEWYQYS